MMFDECPVANGAHVTPPLPDKAGAFLKNLQFQGCCGLFLTG
jgi:hypothetical protein